MPVFAQWLALVLRRCGVFGLRNHAGVLILLLILGGGAPLEKEWRGHLQEVKVFLPVWAYTRLFELGFISVAAATQCTLLSGASPWCFIRVCCGVLFWSARQQYFGLALVDRLRETSTNRARLPSIVHLI